MVLQSFWNNHFSYLIFCFITVSDEAAGALHKAGAILVIKSTPDSAEDMKVNEYKSNLMKRFRDLRYDVSSWQVRSFFLLLLLLCFLREREGTMALTGDVRRDSTATWHCNMAKAAWAWEIDWGTWKPLETCKGEEGHGEVEKGLFERKIK